MVHRGVVQKASNPVMSQACKLVGIVGVAVLAATWACLPPDERIAAQEQGRAAALDPSGRTGTVPDGPKEGEQARGTNRERVDETAPDQPAAAARAQPSHVTQTQSEPVAQAQPDTATQPQPGAPAHDQHRAAAQDQPRAAAQTQPGAKAQQPPEKATPALGQEPNTDHRPVVVLLDVPGGDGSPTGTQTRLWRRQLEAFAPNYRVLPIPIPRSFDRSQTPAIRNVADIVEETLKRRQVTNFALAAYGDDGPVAIELAARRAADVPFLVLVDVIPRRAEVIGSDDAPRSDAAVIDPLERLTMPVLVFFRGDLDKEASAQRFMDKYGYDLIDQVRVRRVESPDPILETAAEDINRKLSTFLDDVAAKRTIVPETRQKTESGLVYVDQYVGDGPSPQQGQTLTLRMRVRLRDGTDVTPCGGFALPRKVTFGDDLIPGLREGLATMKVGGKRKLLIPPRLAYKGKGDGRKIPPDAPLNVDVVLVEISDEPIPEAPSWNPKTERAVSADVRVVDRKTGDGEEVGPDSIVTFDYKLWNAAGVLLRATPPGRPRRSVLRDTGSEAKLWPVGMVGMREGGERLIIGKAGYTFGDQLMPGTCADEDVVFRITMRRVEDLGPRPKLTPVALDQYKEIAPGVFIHDIEVGDGPSPTADSAVAVHYAVWPDKHKDNPESLLDSSRMRREPYVIPLKMCAASWRAALPSMKAGGRRQLRAPYQGPERAGIEEGEWVIYEIDLLCVMTEEECEAHRNGPPGRNPCAKQGQSDEAPTEDSQLMPSAGTP